MPDSRHGEGLVGSFPPLARSDARVLVLGSMPGLASLAAGQYYAHPRNLFWPIMGRLFGAGPDLAYPLRCARLLDAGVAVWDVLAHCRRPGSLDSAIDPTSIEANDFAAFFAAHPRISAVYFNGATAEQVFRRRVHAVGVVTPSVRQRLPSTSPAHAALTHEQKLQAWRAISETLSTG